MGDSGALLLGFTLGAVSVQGLLKTAALPMLVLPLIVLAIPLIDTSFVVAKRIKQRPPDLPRRPHPPPPPLRGHRLLAAPRGRLPLPLVRLAGADRPRDALRAAAAGHHGRGHWDPLHIAIDAAITLLALAASVYVVYLLEIVKLANPFIRRRAELARVDERTAQRLAPSRSETKSARYALRHGACAVTNSPRRSAYAARAMEPSQPRGVPSCRGGRAAGVGDRCSASAPARSIGWALGGAAIGLIVGAVVGLPAGVAAVYRRYHGYFA